MKEEYLGFWRENQRESRFSTLIKRDISFHFHGGVILPKKRERVGKGGKRGRREGGR